MTALQLKRLEAYGFKSFADKIVIEFNKGITAIVGPNGSGKSNITDAIRWVLGEQNIRNLRGLKSEDIIFAGSVSRHALGVAEVSLIFDNDGELPVDFKEVEVTRRIFRSGESEFYINKARCRLKDIYELFADTGLGHDGMSIIGQNRMDEILNSKPEERRLFFEETAGITKYRNRKRESMRKLDDTEHNLLRVTDIIHEIENQLGPLAVQAEKTKRHNALQEEYKDCRLTGIYRSYQRLQDGAVKNQQQQKGLQDQEIEAQTALRLTETRKEELDKQQLEIEKAMQDLSEKNNALRGRMENITGELRIFEERRHQSEAELVRLAEQKQALEKEAGTAQQELAKLTEAEGVQQQELTAAQEKLQQQNDKAAALGVQIRQRKEAYRRQEQQKQEKQQALMEQQQALALLQRDMQAHEESRLQREQELADSRQAQETLQAEAKRAEENLQQTLQAQEALAQRRQQEEQQQSRLLQEQQTQEKKLQALRQQQQLAGSKLQLLKNMQQAYDGFGRSVKTVLKSRESWRRGVCGAAAELFEVPQQYITAIEIALGGSVQNIVTENTDVAKQAIAFLKRERAGRVTFLPLSELVARKPAAGPELQEPGVLGYASSLVGIDEKYRKIADFLLGRTLVTDTLDHALALAKKQGYRMRIVTLEGELLNPGGSLSGGSRQHKDTGFLSRSGEIRDLEQELQRLQAQEPLLLQAGKELQQRLENGAAELTKLQEELQSQQVRQAELRVTRDRMTGELAQRAQALQTMEQQAESQEVSFAAAQKKKVEAAHALQLLETAFQELSARTDEAGEELDDLEQDAADLAKYIQDCSLKKVVLEQGVLRCHEHLLLRQKELSRTRESLTRNAQEQQSIRENLQQGGTRLLELQQQNEALQGAYDAGTAEHKQLYESKMAGLVESQKNDKAARTAASALNKLQQKLHEFELALSEIQFKLEQCRTTLQEEYSLQPEEAAGHVLDLSNALLQEKMQALHAEMQELGQVNPNAITEYEEAQKRHDFMQKQSDDLLQAKENLVNILHEMDVTMTRQFKTAFVKINEYFRDIFVKLFGGGSAELLLTDEKNVLEAGVEILVQLPEKKRQNLTALSGGERALTVIALLFSFLKYKPSPFSVLDEIDAPLDEANISRFCVLLKEFAENTQFIVVTHRKGTMEAADVMYGVTIEDAGVSKVISVRLDEV